MCAEGSKFDALEFFCVSELFYGMYELFVYVCSVIFVGKAVCATPSNTGQGRPAIPVSVKSNFLQYNALILYHH